MTLHRGKIAREPIITNVRALTRDDLLLLKQDETTRTERAKVGVVQKLKDHHHRLARLVASGLRTHEIMERAGVSYTRFITIRKDPAFIELVAKYRGKVDEAWAREQDAYANVAVSNMLKAEVMLAEKLEIAEEEGIPLPTRDLIAISRDAADRFGYGKRNMNLNVNVDFAAQLEKTIARSKGTTIEATATVPTKVLPSSRPQSQADRVPASTPPGSSSQPLRRLA